MINQSVLKDHKNIMGFIKSNLNTVKQNSRFLFQLFIEMEVADSTFREGFKIKGESGWERYRRDSKWSVFGTDI